MGMASDKEHLNNTINMNKILQTLPTYLVEYKYAFYKSIFDTIRWEVTY